MVSLHGNRRNLRSDIIFAAALAVLGYVAWLVRGVLVLLYVSALFAAILTPVVRATGRIRIGRWQPLRGSAAIFFLLLAVAGSLTAYGAYAFPPVIHDLQNLSNTIPTRVPQLVSRFEHLPFASHLNKADISVQVQNYANHAVAMLLVSIKSWAGKLIDIAMGFILTVYFILEGDQAYQWFLSFFPVERRERLDDVLRRANVRMGKWLLGQGSLMLILGTSSTITFALLHVRYAYALGVFTGLLNIIPVLGSAISIILAVLVAAIDSWGKVLGVAIFFAIYIQIENSYLTPRIMQSRVHLPGLAVIIALLVGFAMAGVVGALVAVPSAVLVAVLLDEYLVQNDTKNGTAAESSAEGH